MYLKIIACIYVFLLDMVIAFTPTDMECRPRKFMSKFVPIHSLSSSALYLSSQSNIPQMKEAEMTLDELKSELDLRGVDYEDCVSKNELVERLVQSRTLGRANPDIINRFSEEISSSDAPNISEALDSEIVAESVAKDGGLPGGMSPELMKSLTSNPEVMRMLRDPKMLDIMQAVMKGGPDAMKKYMSDPDAVMLLQKLSGVMGKLIK